MTHAGFLPRSWIILGVVLPLAAFIGYVLATPDAVDGLAFVGLIVGILSLPVLLRWHHLILVMSWNATLTVFFLPGQPSLWMLMALLSLTGSLLNKDFKFQNVPVVTWSLLFLAAVVLITAKLTGGIGVRALGGT